MANTKQEKLYALLDAIEEYKDAITYGKKWDKFDRVVSSKKQALINFDSEEGLFIKEFKAFRRALINAGASSALKTFSSSKKSIQKGMSYDQYAKWKQDLDAKIPQIERDFNNKLIVPITASYGKGFDRGMEDLGYKPKDEWMYLPGHAIPRLTNLRLVNYISNNLSIDMTAVVVEGMRAGKNGNDIARGLRSLINAPKKIDVKPKYDAKGTLKRRGYQYEIPIKRYSEMIGRTEVNRATNLGRLDSYKQSGLVKSVVFITAGDDRVCPECEGFLDKVVPVSQAFTIIPVHVMCRCTWEAYEYKTDEESRTNAEAAFQTDLIDKAENTSPLIPYAEGRKATQAAIDRYRQHLKYHNLDNSSGHGKIYTQLKKQLKSLGVEGFEGFKFGQFDNIYALHTFKNARFALQRGLQKPLPKIKTLKYNSVIGKDKNLLGQATHYTKSGENIVEISDAGIYEHLFRTSVHEQGHTIWPTLNSKSSGFWEDLYKTSKANNFITNYAKSRIDEDFCETLAWMITNPNKVRKIIPDKYSFMENMVFKKTPSAPKLPTIPTKTKVSKFVTEEQLAIDPEVKKALIKAGSDFDDLFAIKDNLSNVMFEAKKSLNSQAFCRLLRVDPEALDKLFYSYTEGTTNPAGYLIRKAIAGRDPELRRTLASELRSIRAKWIKGQGRWRDNRKELSRLMTNFSPEQNRAILLEKLYQEKFWTKYLEKYPNQAKVYRGLSFKELPKAFSRSNPGDTLIVQDIRTVSSWSRNNKAAQTFADEGSHGIVLEAKLTPKDIVGSRLGNPDAYGRFMAEDEVTLVGSLNRKSKVAAIKQNGALRVVPINQEQAVLDLIDEAEAALNSI